MKRLSERQKQKIERTVANNRSYKLYLYNRFFIFLLLVLGQLVGLVLLTYLFVYNTAIGVLLQVLVSVCPVLTV